MKKHVQSTRLSQEEMASFIKDYNSGMTQQKLASKYNVSRQTVCKYLKKHSNEVHITAHNAKELQNRRKLTEEQIKTLTSEYACGATMRYLSKKYDITETTISRYLKNIRNLRHELQTLMEDIEPDYNALYSSGMAKEKT